MSNSAVRRDHHPYRLYGAMFLLAIAGLVAVCVASFKQLFTPAAYVEVHIAKAGQQLLPGSDVKLRGIDVGTVDTITSNGNGAQLKLRMNPSMLPEIPSNVTVRLIPKTLFGEKYVDLEIPSQPAGTHLAAGATIAEDRTAPALEIDQALNDLLPLLRTVQPQQLDLTLNAIATALQGRGNELGQTIQQLDTYFKGINPQLPTLKHDVTALSTTAHTYDQAAGPLLDMLGNLTVTSNTIVDQKQQLSALLNDVTATAQSTRDFLARNARNLVEVNAVNKQVIALLARYSPELACFIQGDAGLVPRIHDAVPKQPGLNHAAHVVVEFVPAFPTYQYPVDLPEFQDKRGPSCYGLPHPPMSLPVIHYKDGTQDDPRFKNQGGQSSSAATSSAHNAAFDSPSMGTAGTAQEQATFDSLLGPILAMPASRVPDIADLLWGPMVRGGTVSLSSSQATS